MVLVFILIGILIAGVTGGSAGAFVRHGSENRSLALNADIGLVGWSAAWVAWSLMADDLSVGTVIFLAILAFFFCVGIVRLLEAVASTQHGPAVRM